MVAGPIALYAPILLGLLALAALIAAVFLLRRAAMTPATAESRNGEIVVHTMPPSEARKRRLTLAGIAVALLLSVAFGRHFVSLLRPSGDPPQDQFGQMTKRITGPSGAELAIEESGPAGAPRLVFTHGWGADRREWTYARRRLSERFRVVTWDLPGLGQSKPIPDGDYALARMASDLRAVVDATGNEPAILVGHSIGGMINLTLCQQNGGSPGPNVSGIVQLNTTYTNPVKTVAGHEVQEKLQKPLYEPMLHVISAASPIARALAWLGYQSGLVQLQTASSSFAGQETREQLDFASRYYYRSSPAVVARGTLGMLHWDASDVLSRITVPVLIVSGDQDTTTLPSASDHMSSTIPVNSRVAVNPAAHLGPIEQHAQYNSAIETFATAHLSGERQVSRQAQ